MSSDPTPPAVPTKCYWCDGTGHSLGAAPDRGNPVCGKCDGTGVLPTPPATPRTPPAEIDRLKALRDEFGEKEAACKRAMEAAGSVQEIYAAADPQARRDQPPCLTPPRPLSSQINLKKPLK
jgi:hypothetical protein